MAESNHKMLSEIKEQAVIAATIVKREHDSEFGDVVHEIQDAINHDGDVYFVGSGSSYHSAVFASHLFAKNNYFISTAVPAGDFDTYTPDLQKRDLVIFISQSGTNPTILESFNHIVQRFSKTIAITNDIDAPLTNRVDKVLSLEVKREEAVPATKTYLAELLVLSIISEGMKDGSKLYNSRNEISEEINKICQEDFYNKMNGMAQFLASSSDAFVLAEGIEYANALEAALKFKECALLDAEAYLLDEFLHGPIAMVKTKTPIILFNTNIDQNSQSKIEKIKKAGGVIICIGGEKRSKTDATIPVKDFGIFTSIVSIVPIQLLAYKTAIMKGLDPDKPRGLSKTAEY